MPTRQRVTRHSSSSSPPKLVLPRVILEATGVYSLRLALALDQAGRVEVMGINPRTAKDFQRARLTRAKTDRLDAMPRGGWTFSPACPLWRGRLPPPQSLACSSSPGAWTSAKANAPGNRHACMPALVAVRRDTQIKAFYKSLQK